MRIVITNDNKNNTYFEEAGYRVVLIHDSNLRAKIESASLIFMKENLKSEKVQKGYFLIQKMIEEKWNVKAKIGIITQINSYRCPNPKIQTIQRILPPYKLPLSPKAWKQHLLQHNHMQTFDYVKQKYRREHPLPRLTFFQRVKNSFF